jgi:integron integrase
MNSNPKQLDIRYAINTGSPRFFDKLRLFIRQRGLAYSTEKTYCLWIRRFILFNRYGSEAAFRTQDIGSFLSHLSNNRHCSPNTQRTALNALVFLFREYLGVAVNDLAFVYAREKPRVPVVLSRDEASHIIDRLSATPQLCTQLMYGSGLRVGEVLHLRVKDIDFANSGLYVMEAKGGKSRRTLLPESLIPSLKQQIGFVERQLASDTYTGKAGVYLPNALATKWPNAQYELRWQYLFPSGQFSIDPRSGVERRHHISADLVRRAIKQVVGEVGIQKRVSCHTFRHSFATELGIVVLHAHHLSTPA